MSVPREERIHRAGVDRRRNTGACTGSALVGSRQWATGPGHIRSGSSVKTLNQCPEENALWTAARRWARASLGCSAQAQNQPIGAQHRPPSSGFFETPGLPAGVFLVPRAGGVHGRRVVWPGHFERLPSFLWPSCGCLFPSAYTCPALSAKTQQKRWLFFRASGVLVSVVCRWQCCSKCDHPISPPPFELEKNTTKPFAADIFLTWSKLAGSNYISALQRPLCKNFEQTY